MEIAAIPPFCCALQMAMLYLLDDWRVSTRCWITLLSKRLCSSPLSLCLRTFCIFKGRELREQVKYGSVLRAWRICLEETLPLVNGGGLGFSSWVAGLLEGLPGSWRRDAATSSVGQFPNELACDNQHNSHFSYSSAVFPAVDPYPQSSSSWCSRADNQLNLPTAHAALAPQSYRDDQPQDRRILQCYRI
jgi:hypothetical protein